MALVGVSSAATLNLTSRDTLLSTAIANSGYTEDQITEITFTDGVAITIDQAITIGTFRFADNETIKNVTFNFTWDGYIKTTDKVWLTDSSNNQVQSVTFGLIIEGDDVAKFQSVLANNETYTKTIFDTNKTWELEQVFTNNKVQLTLSDSLINMGYSVATGNVTNASTLDTGKIGVGQSAWDQPVQMLIARAVPEPTTATLSLLALAGLAARRRRK